MAFVRTGNELKLNNAGDDIEIGPYAGRIDQNDVNTAGTTFIHPMFGVLPRRNNAVGAGDVDIAFEYKDFVGRETGLYDEIIKNDKLVKGLANPSNYLRKKNADLIKINAKLTDMYRDTLEQFLNYGYSVEHAKKQALDMIDSYKKRLLVIHEKEFPVEITRSVLEKAKRRGEIGEGRIDNGNVRFD